MNVNYFKFFNEDSIHMVMAAMVGLFLIVVALIANRKLVKTEQCLVPHDKPTPSTMFELIVESLLNLMEGVLGDKAQKFFPLIGALFIYIFTCNLIGLIPGLAPPTENINTNAACAIVVFLYYNYMGIREQGLVHYLKHFMGPVIWLGPLMLVIELISHAVRPVSLSIRLFGNMTGDHMVLGVFSQLTPIVVPIIFMFLGLFISFIQAFVFSLLSIVYIGLATEKSH
ncbi:MAG: F0F1 ATP synthase subunit A [Deltaproteobacteria bacterium]|nr:F0F1 ATP synthase subunit A [Deltaproteobacteria bacterium]MDZ4224515.1 F0F1 ATP synthase subunit A [bacterium]